MSKAPDLRAFDTSIPLYDRTPNNRATRAALVKFVDSVGTHLICPRRACQREGGCADRDMGALPFCWEHYRGMLRFLLCVLEKLRGINANDPVGEEDLPMPQPFRGEPLLARWAAAGADIQSLARSAEDGPERWSWERVPALQERFRQMTEGAR